MLQVRALDAGYGDVQVLRGVSLQVAPGEILCVLGRNGAGKTTLMKAIMGLVRVSKGEVILDGQTISALPPHQIPRHGLGYVPQGRRLFPDLTVRENLQVGLLSGGGNSGVRARVLDIFPRLRERLDQRAGTLSGGEQQMLATGRALCLEPKVILFDEPTEGLQPSMIAAIREVILKMRGEGAAVVLVEQRVDAVLDLADRVMFLENGQASETVGVEVLRKADRTLLDRYVGV